MTHNIDFAKRNSFVIHAKSFLRKWFPQWKTLRFPVLNVTNVFVKKVAPIQVAHWTFTLKDQHHLLSNHHKCNRFHKHMLIKISKEEVLEWIPNKIIIFKIKLHLLRGAPNNYLHHHNKRNQEVTSFKEVLTLILMEIW